MIIQSISVCVQWYWNELMSRCFSRFVLSVRVGRIECSSG